MSLVLIGLGSNEGDREFHLRRAADALRAHPEIRDFQLSRFRETVPVGGPPQGSFLNAAALFRTAMSAPSLLSLLQSLERESGRVRREKNGPRTLDLDILLYGSETIDLPQLKVPHPRMLERGFVLDPLIDFLERAAVSS